MVKKVTLKDVSIEFIEFLYSLNADENQIEEFEIEINQSFSQCAQLAKIIWMSGKAHTFMFTIHQITSQREAELLWEFLRAATNCNCLAKNIELDVRYIYSISYTTSWSFRGVCLVRLQNGEDGDKIPEILLNKYMKIYYIVKFLIKPV